MNTLSEFPDRLTVELQVLPSSAPGNVRVKRWLKLGLRAFGIRCLSIGPAAEQQPPDPPAGPPE